MAHNRYLDNALIYSTIRLYIFSSAIWKNGKHGNNNNDKR